jgi:hypothetical protein
MAGAGFLVELGADGAMVDAGHVSSYAEASEWLKKTAVRHYPASAFGRETQWLGKGRYIVEANTAALMDFVICP